MTKCDKCGKEILKEIVICDECQADYENDLDAKTPALDYSDDEDKKDSLASSTIISALEFAYQFGRSSCMGLDITFDDENKFIIIYDDILKSKSMGYDDAMQVLFDYYKAHLGKDERLKSTVKRIKEVFNKLRQLDLFNTKAVYGAFQLGYLDSDYDCITIEAEERYCDEKGVRLVHRYELVCGTETITLHISVIVKSDYTRFNRISQVFNAIIEAFRDEYERIK